MAVLTVSDQGAGSSGGWQPAASRPRARSIEAMMESWRSPDARGPTTVQMARRLVGDHVALTGAGSCR